jgi:hypothetical protein
MKKSAILDIHLLLGRIHCYLEEERPENLFTDNKFETYESLASPTEVTKSSSEHKQAAIELANAMSTNLAETIDTE